MAKRTGLSKERKKPEGTGAGFDPSQTVRPPSKPKPPKKKLLQEGAADPLEFDANMTLTSAIVASELVREGKVDLSEMARAVDLVRHKGEHLTDVLFRSGLSSEQFLELLRKGIADQPIDLQRGRIPVELAEKLPREKALELVAVPVCALDSVGRLVVAMEKPDDLGVIDTLEFVTGLEIDPVPAKRSEILEAIARLYGGEVDGASPSAEAGPGVDAAVDDLELPSVTISEESLAKEAEDAGESAGTLASLVHAVLYSAVQAGASDIHVEAKEDRLRVRFRVDGVLHEQSAVSKVVADHFVNRIKILASMDIAEKRRPQDGRIRRVVGGRDVEFRVSTVPVLEGEKVVMRVVDRSRPVPPLDQLNLSAENLSTLRTVLGCREGMLIMTGPTGSGKTTTLYSALCELANSEVNIHTIEDPVEHEFDAMSQSPVSVAAGFNFADGLRAILRQDPDIILVGEMRDQETASVACQAAMTGHLVLSTVHAASAAHAPLRLINMGVETHIAAQCVQGVLAQRLLRRICSHCSSRSPTKLSELKQALWGEQPESSKVTVKLKQPGSGCDRCLGGYSGRVPVHEVVSLTPAMRGLLIDGASSDTLALKMREEGCPSLRDDAMEKVLEGLTSVEEVLRVLGVPGRV